MNKSQMCGLCPLPGPIGNAGPDKGPVRGPLTRKGLEALIAGKNNPSQLLCPWLLLVSRNGETESWSVRRHGDEHTCLQSRALKHFDLNYISKKIKEKIQTNPQIPMKSIC